jgi:hypothetical protein
MKKWYFSAALLAAGWLGQAGDASAQGVLPSPLGAARIPDPIPCNTPTPDLVPGPISPLSAPPGPPTGTDLPADHSNAFPCENFVPDDHWYFNAGSVGLMRQKLGNQPIAVVDPVSLKNDIRSAGELPVAQSFSDIGQDFNFGPKATIGYLWGGNQAIEVTGFWIPETHTTANNVMPGQLDQFFTNPPLGFEGDNGMFIHDDRVFTQFNSSMWNAEVNYRYTNPAVLEVELIAGLRYLDVYESILSYTGDDDLTAPQANGTPDPIRQAFYQVRTENRIVAPQIGFEACHSFTQWLTLGMTAKAAVGADFEDIHTTLTRGDGLVGFDNQRQKVVGGAQIYDLGAYIDFNPLEKMHIRLGYNALFLVNVAPAINEFNYNLAAPGTGNDHGSIFYHGPSAELQILF